MQQPTPGHDARPARRDRIFISYRRADSAGHAGRLKDDLVRLLGERVFMDVSDIAPGADFEDVLRCELASCGAVLAVIGPRWTEAFDAPRVGQDYVRLELAQALAQADVLVVPVLMQGATLPAPGKLPADVQPLESRQATVIRDDRWKDDVAHLARELGVALKVRRLPVRWIAASLAVVAALAVWFLAQQKEPPASGPFSRARAQAITMAATTKAAAACKPAFGVSGACPLVFSFVPDGSARNVYFDSGSCVLKAPPFGECVLNKLGAVRIPPFNDVPAADVGLSLFVNERGAVKAVVDE